MSTTWNGVNERTRLIKCVSCGRRRHCHVDTGRCRRCEWTANVAAFLTRLLERRGWRRHRCVVCREQRWMTGEINACMRCRRDPQAIRDAVTYNIYRHLNQHKRNGTRP